jgi:hypothetical membrane protein
MFRFAWTLQMGGYRSTIFLGFSNHSQSATQQSGGKIMRKSLALCGVGATLLYLATVILGGFLTPGYSHMAHAISELIGAGAPAKEVLDPLFIVYNFLVVGAGLGLLRTFDPAPRKIAAGGLLLVATGAAGVVLTLFFPMDPRGAAPTLPGIIHLVLSGIISLLTMASVLTAGLGFRQLPGWAGLGTYSVVTTIIIFISGLSAAVAATQGLAVMGLLERITIGFFLQWVFVIGLRLLAAERTATAAG